MKELLVVIDNSSDQFHFSVCETNAVFMYPWQHIYIALILHELYYFGPERYLFTSNFEKDSNTFTIIIKRLEFSI